MSRAFVFPGQGSQAVGMGQSLAEAFPIARETFEEIDDALEQRLYRLMTSGPDDELMLTENAQPALMAVSMAVIRVLESEGRIEIADTISCVAGHSLGEYSALAAVRSLSLPDVARLLKERGQAMQQAVPVGEGAMAVLLGLNPADAEVVAEQSRQGEVCDFPLHVWWSQSHGNLRSKTSPKRIGWAEATGRIRRGKVSVCAIRCQVAGD